MSSLVLATGFALACVSPPPPVDPLDAIVVEAGENEGLRIDNVVILLDASGSMEPQSIWGSTQNLASSFVGGMPEGSYRAGVITFGGDENQIHPLAPFDRDDLDGAIFEHDLLGKSSDIAAAIRDAADQLEGRVGRSAIVLFSDGIASRYGRTLGPASTIAAAKRLVALADDEVCFHTIQSGDDPAGTELMSRLSGVTACGKHIDASSLGEPESLEKLQRTVFLEEVRPVVAAAPPEPEFVDTDHDGVEDASDQCPGTPKMAQVNEVGCWTLDRYAFEPNKWEIRASQFGQLDEVAKVLESNPELRIRIDGHTDSTGTAEFNQVLSERRANAVRTYLAGVGIDPARLETRGFGMSEPIASNDTPEGRAQNRRCQMTILK